jgi:ATP-dependent Clp protease ATP-binding subunit ClpC
MASSLNPARLDLLRPSSPAPAASATSAASLASELRRIVEELAKSRGERPTTAHLLTALGRFPSDAQKLLQSRRLTDSVLCSALRAASDDQDGAYLRILSRASASPRMSPTSRDAVAPSLARRPSNPSPSLRPPEPNKTIAIRSGTDAQASKHTSDQPSASSDFAMRVLLLLCEEPGLAAYRILTQCGIDPQKFRAYALQVAMGAASVPRTNAPASAPTSGTFAVASSQRPLVSPQAASPAAASSVQGAPVAASPAQSLKTAAPMLPSAGDLREAAEDRSRSVRAKAERDTRSKAKRSKSKDGKAFSSKEFPLLTQFAVNLSALAEEGELEPVFGRDLETTQVFDVLARRQAHCPLLVGPSGVGKSSVARAVAQCMQRSHFALEGEDFVVMEVAAPALLAATGMRGQLAERLSALAKECVRASALKPVLLFVDDVHAVIVGDGNDEGAAEFRRILQMPGLHVMAAISQDAYSRSIERDTSLLRLVTPMHVQELGADAACEALEHVSARLSEHHGVRVTPEGCNAAQALSTKYMPYRLLPEKAIEVLDFACARAKRRGHSEVRLVEVAEVISEQCNIPLSRLTESDGERLLRFEQLMAERVIGHAPAMHSIGRVLRRNASGIGGRRPIGSFLLLGPTGVGKTETAKAVADVLFGSPDAMTRLDMSEYAESHSIAKLIGAPPGYVGFESGGALTEAVRRRPYQVILLDEIEKADRDVLEAFLQVLDEGRLTDSRGKTFDFTNTVLLLTSNLGAQEATEKPRAAVGFSARRDVRMNDNERDARVLKAARHALPPELYNRFDDVLVFRPLEESEVKQVALQMLGKLADSLRKSRGVTLEFADEVPDWLLRNGGYDSTLGARPMRRTIGRHVEAMLAECILKATPKRGEQWLIEVDEDVLKVRTASFQLQDDYT